MACVNVSFFLYRVFFLLLSLVNTGGEASRDQELELSPGGLMELDLGADEVFITASDPSHPGLPLASQTVHPSSRSFSAKSGFRGVVKMSIFDNGSKYVFHQGQVLMCKLEPEQT